MNRDERIQENTGLVHTCARRFKGRGIEYDDLFQAGCLGLIKAAERFDESRGLCFSTYAVPVILGEIRRLFREDGTVKMSRSLREMAMKANRVTTEFLQREGRQPTVKEVASILGVEPEQAAQAIAAGQMPLSLTMEDEDGESQLDIAVEPEEELLTEKLSLRKAVKELQERDKKIIYLRYVKSSTQAETARELGMTQVQISRREKVILRTLREKLG
ncbi:MAG: sigma-70 family RNA polymerase sigma factor [Hydrogeniiclostridium sp.]